VGAPKVDFYTLGEPDRRARLVTACRLAEKAYEQGLRVVVRTASAAETAEFDEPLGTVSDRSFVPPCLRATKPGPTRGPYMGTAQAFKSSLANQPLLIGAALLAVYIVLGVLYESLIHPLTILSSLPSAGVGALLALMALRVELSVIAFIGIILLIGIVKKNAILMIDFAIQVERNEGKRPEEAIFQACLLRFRPITITTMAALLGGLPLALGMGTGAELRRPLGIAIVGGLIFSQMLTLYTTPVVYLYMDRFQLRWAAWRKRRFPSRAAGPVVPESGP